MVKILAIDDNNDNLISLNAIINDALPDSVLFTALNGAQGIELALANDPDVILLDVLMPGMDGFEVCHRLKQDEAMSDIPVVFLTALRGDKESRIKALESGAEAFLSKPVDEIELTAQIRAMIKIKSANRQKRNEKERLTMLVAERTRELEKSHNETLKLIEELQNENNSRKKIEEELREREEKYRLLHESAGVGIGYYTLDGIVISYNKVAAFNMNGKPEDFKGKSIYSLFPKADADFYLDRIRKAANSETNMEYEDRVELPTQVKWFQSIFTRIQDSGNKVVGVQIISTDITGRKQAEGTLNVSEARLRRAEIASKSGNWELHLDSKMMTASEGAVKLYGVGEDHFDYEMVKKIPLQEYRQLLDEALKKLIEEDQPYDLEFRIKKVDTGEIKDIHSIASFDREKRIVFGIIQDITDRKRSEEILIRSEEKYRTLIETAPDAFFQGDIMGNFITVNDKACLLTGFSCEELLLMNMADIFSENILDDKPLRYDLLISGDIIKTERKIKRKSGEYIDVEMNSKANPDGTYQSFLRDVTDRKRIEDSLRESEERFEQFMANLPSAVFMKDHDSRLIFANQSLKDLFGWNDAIGKLTSELLPPEMAGKMIEDDFRVMQNGPEIIHERVIDIKGREFYFETHKFPFYKLNGEVLLGAISINETERRLAEETLKESENRLRELNATKDKFFSIIAHDLKNPFNAILGFSNLLVEQIQEKEYEGLEEYANIIRNSSQNAMDLLLNLLEWSRSQTGKMEFNPEYVETVGLINEVVLLLNDSAVQKSIKIMNKLPRNFIIYADKAMISTILRNLISNAIKFTYSGGEIIISAVKGPDELIISVSDNGMGIRKESIDKLFRIDENYSAKGTQNEKGTGLGLILCKEFVEKHEGKIWVESEAGKGSTFSFTIPRR